MVWSGDLFVFIRCMRLRKDNNISSKVYGVSFKIIFIYKFERIRLC